MTYITHIRHRIGKWLWKGNEWTRAVDDVERAIKELREGKKNVVWLVWRFGYMEEPPSNICKVRIELQKRRGPELCEPKKQ
jgi:hypothetical protein